MLQYNILPLPNSWLDYNLSLNHFGPNSIIHHIQSVMEITHQTNTALLQQYQHQYKSYHHNMIDPNTPFCCSSQIERHLFRSLLFNSSTSKQRCKQYLQGDIQRLSSVQIQSDNIYVVNMDSDHVSKLLIVDIMQADGTFNNLHSILKLSKYTDKDYLLHGKRFGEFVRSSCSTGIRKSDGNHGSLHTYGLHEYNSSLEPFSSMHSIHENQLVFDNFIKSTMNMANSMFPIKLSVMIQLEYSCGITREMKYHPCHNLESDLDGPCLISTSINFATPQHVDVQDGSISIFGWFHLSNPQPDVYFILGNMGVKVDGHEFTGLAVKIVDGLVIVGNGRMLCHGTTASDYDGSIFGMQFAANGMSMVSKINE